MARKYFGTDGMRGEANKDLTIDLVTRLGLALGYYLKKHRKKAGKPKIILGTDTRISGYMIRSALTAGLNSMGVNIDFVGVLPTPGVGSTPTKSIFTPIEFNPAVSAERII